MPCHSVPTWYYSKCCAQQELPSLSGDKLCSPRAPQSVGGPVNLPLHGPIAAHVWSEPTLGGSPSAPYRQGLCQVSPTNGHPPGAHVWHPGRWSYTLRGHIAADYLLWTYRDPEQRGTQPIVFLEVRGLTTSTMHHSTEANSKKEIKRKCWSEPTPLHIQEAKSIVKWNQLSSHLNIWFAKDRRKE